MHAHNWSNKISDMTLIKFGANAAEMQQSSIATLLRLFVAPEHNYLIYLTVGRAREALDSKPVPVVVGYKCALAHI